MAGGSLRLSSIGSPRAVVVDGRPSCGFGQLSRLPVIFDPPPWVQTLPKRPGGLASPVLLGIIPAVWPVAECEVVRLRRAHERSFRGSTPAVDRRQGWAVPHRIEVRSPWGTGTPEPVEAVTR